MKKRILIVLTLVALIFIASGALYALRVGGKLQSVKLISPSNSPMWIPHIGKKVITIMYGDPDVQNIADPLNNVILARKYSAMKFAGIGIGNCKDTWLPNGAIRMGARSKLKQFPGSIILLDEKHTLKNKWYLGDCNNKVVIIVIAKDRTIKYVSKVANKAQCRLIIPKVMKIIDTEMKK